MKIVVTFLAGLTILLIGVFIGFLIGAIAATHDEEE